MTKKQKDNLKEFIAVLRSGMYRQLNAQVDGAYLRTDNGYSPEGILCQLFGDGEWYKDPPESMIYSYGHNGFGFIVVVPMNIYPRVFGTEDLRIYEMHRNGMTFDQIADELEKRFEKEHEHAK